MVDPLRTLGDFGDQTWLLEKSPQQVGTAGLKKRGGHMATVPVPSLPEVPLGGREKKRV